MVQEALGHSTIAVTLDLYSHVVPSLQREAAKEMGEALLADPEAVYRGPLSFDLVPFTEDAMGWSPIRA